MKISKFAPIFSVLFLALIAATDFVLYNEVDASDAEGFTLLISLPAFFIKIYIMIIPALILFFATLPLFGKAGFVTTGILTTLLALTETAFAIFLSLATGGKLLLLLMVMGIWGLGVVVVLFSGINSDIHKQGEKAEKQYKIELDRKKSANKTEEND